MNLKIKLLLVLFILFAVPVAHALQSVIVLNVELYKNDTANLINLRLESGAESFELSAEPNEYKIELIAKDGVVIYNKYFGPSFDVMIDILPSATPPPDGKITVEKILLTLKVPYFENVKSVKIYHSNTLILSADIVLCTKNQVCESDLNENLLSCPSDCPSGSVDGFCDGLIDGICDKDCVAQGRIEKDIDCTCGNSACDEREDANSCSKDCKHISGKKTYVIYVIGALIAIIFVILLTYSFKRQNKREEVK